MFTKRVKGHYRKGLSKPEKSSFEELETYLNRSPKNRDGIIYFHIPFCDHICSFCSMNRTKLKDELNEYTKFLLKEIDKFSKYKYIKEKNIKSIYFGGGTPTILHEKHLDKILNSINKNFHLSKDIEYSSESTLHNLPKSKVKMMQNLGINRYSIGIQTFSSTGRKLLNRIGNQKKVLNQLREIREIFNGHLCIDIIYNYPYQTIDEVIADANFIKKLDIDSASFYSLMYSASSNLAKNIDEHYYDLEHDRNLHNAFLQNLLDSKNYEILEYTKVVKKNRDRYRYITLGHKGVDTVPIGVGAGGRIGKYFLFSPRQGMRMVSKSSQRDLDYGLFSALFQYEKINLKKVKSYLCDETFSELMTFFKQLENEKYLNIDKNYLNLNIDGIFWGNTIATRVLDMVKNDFIK